MRVQNPAPKYSGTLLCYLIVLCLCILSIFHTIAIQRRQVSHSNLRRHEELEAITQKIQHALEVIADIVEESTNLTQQIQFEQKSVEPPRKPHPTILPPSTVQQSIPRVESTDEVPWSGYIQSGVSEYYKYPRLPGNCATTSISHKYDEQCITKLHPEFIRQVLVVAVQRSGTHFIWEMLNRLGCDVHHEGVGPHGAVSWLYAYRSPTYAINNPQPLSKHKFRRVFHQVRHPLLVINTLITIQASWNRFWEWTHSVEPSVRKGLSPLKRAMQLWVAWNKHIEQYADLRYRTEDTSPRDVCRWAGFPESKCGNLNLTQPVVELSLPKYRQQALPASTSHAVHHEASSAMVTWEMLDAEDMNLSQTIKAMCLEYGYRLELPDQLQAANTKEFKA